MKILQVYDHGAISCGVVSVIMAWNRQLAGSDIIFDYLFSHQRTPSRDEEIRSLGGKVYYVYNDTSIGNYAKFISKVKAFMKEHSSEYDAIHLHTTTFSFPYLYYAKKYGIPIRIAHAHSVSLGNTRLSSYRNVFLTLPLKFYANEFWACSESAAQAWFRKFGIKGYDVILNGIDTEQYKYDPETRKIVRKQLGMSNESIAIVHISNMSAIKNIPFLIETLKELVKKNRNCTLFLIGKNELPNAIESLIHKEELDNYVVNLGVRTDIPKLLQGMDICMMPSLNEGLGIVAVEAQAAGVTTIVSDGFPDDVMVTDIIQKIEFNANMWADNAIRLIGNRETETDNTELEEKFNSKRIAFKVKERYLSIQNKYF